MACGSMAAVISTSALRRGLPQMIAACAPNRYQGRSRSAIVAANARRSSATVRRLDTAEHLRNAAVAGEIVPAVFVRRPIAANLAYVVSQLIADFQRLFRRHARFLFSPPALLEGRDSVPIPR